MRRMLLARGRAAAVAAVTAALFVPLFIFGGSALAHTGAAASEYEYGGSSQYQYRVRICHHTHSWKHPWVEIGISSRAWPAHERHGDTLLPCPTSTTQSIKHHGHAFGKSKSKDDSSTDSSGTTQSSQISQPTGSSGREHGRSGEHSGHHGGD